MDQLVRVKDWLHRNGILAVGLHFALLSCLFLILTFFQFIQLYPLDATLMHWDAGWYANIVAEGYSFTEGQASNTAFFPLFPKMWRLLNVSTLTICYINFAFFCAGSIILRKALGFNNLTHLLILSIPSTMFCYVPYSEALFFFSGAILIYGLRHKAWISYVGIFLCGMARAVSIIFIPIIIFSKLFNLKKGGDNKRILLETGLMILSSGASLLVSQYIQYLESGSFFDIFANQSNWNKQLRIPELPLTTWGEGWLIWLDGIAFLVGLSAIIMIGVFTVRKLRKLHQTRSQEHLFALAYLGTVTLITLLLANPEGRTSVWSLNRYVFASPFFMVFLFYLLKNNSLLNLKNILAFAGISLFTWLLFGAYDSLVALEGFKMNDFKHPLYFFLLFVYTSLYVLMSKARRMRLMLSGVYVFNLLVQIYLFHNFLDGKWVG